MSSRKKGLGLWTELRLVRGKKKEGQAIPRQDVAGKWGLKGLFSHVRGERLRKSASGQGLGIGKAVLSHGDGLASLMKKNFAYQVH